MNKKIQIITVLSLIFSLFLAGLVTAQVESETYKIQADIEKKGTGTGEITLSADSSNDWQFFGWLDDFCGDRGTGLCALSNFIPEQSKIVIANFGRPQCRDFTYTEFSECVLGRKYREVVNSGPPGCIGGDPVLSQLCVGGPCAGFREYQGDSSNFGGGFISYWGAFTDLIADGSKKLFDYLSDSSSGDDFIYPENFGIFTGGGEGCEGNYCVDTSSGTGDTIIKISEGINEGETQGGGSKTGDVSQNGDTNPINLDIFPFDPIIITAPRPGKDTSNFDFDYDLFEWPSYSYDGCFWH
ncbi:hypothetical protein GW950_00295 [Candidatus Wolfebacteria bacterium]|nr:hypothetical protein [Candidatus Wolfebacteria bacterium]